ncbi:MAG: YIP1 family protein [Ardenticatenales bacterium]|nr:YIP1 family protein [Ardenticatenales bacterium]
MVDRMVRAAKGEVALYEEVENTPALTQEAYTIVGIIAALSALGGLLVGFATNVNPITNALYQGIMSVVAYLIWSYLTFFIGTSVFKGTADAGELQRTIAYAMTPQILTFIPVVGFLAYLWSLYLGVVAVRQALDFDTTKALMTTGLALLAVVILSVVVGIVLGVGSAAVGSITG